jgi:Na+/H+ antiporter
VLGLELIVAVGIAVLLASLAARRLGIPSPLPLVATGLLLTLIPPFRGLGLPPEAVLLLFLPPLLYWESLTTSAREIRRFLRGIILNGTLLVIFTAAVVALVAHALGLAWGTAWIIGAAVAPTDATVLTSMAGRLSRGQQTTLRAESLINDGTALVVYALALDLAQRDAVPQAGHVAALFAVSLGGGVLVGGLAGVLARWVRRRVVDPLHNTVAAVLTPFTAYLLAEGIHASGVVAVVTCGLYMSQVAPRIISAQARQQQTPVWTVASFLLNGTLFVLIGLQLPGAVHGLTSVALGRALLVTAAVYVTTVVARLVFQHVPIFTIRVLDRRPYQRTLRTTPGSRMVSAAAGFRGAVSLAVALSVTETLAGGGDFPARDMIVFVTAGVVVASLVLQGLALPRIIRWANLPEDHSVADEVRLAQRTAVQEAFAALPRIAGELGIDADITAHVRSEYEDRLYALPGDAHTDGDGDRGAAEARGRDRQRQYAELRLALIAHKRATVVRMRDARTIDDTALRQVQTHLDDEEVRWSGRTSTE